MVEPGPKTCPQCGHTQAGGEYCELCGTRLVQAAGVSSQAGTGPTTAPPPQMSPPPAGGVPPSYQAPPSAQTPYAAYPSAKPAGFFARLFDFSFQTFVTPSLIKVLFILYLVGIGLTAIGLVVVAFTQSAGLGVLMLLVGVPIFGFIYILIGRVWLEILIVFFRINENIEKLSKSR